MHEIVYLQFGNLPNFIGTHFWNTQDAYSQDEADQQISWSLRETNGRDKTAPILRPRVLLFDRKQNFGTLLDTAVYSEPGQSVALDTTFTWAGPTQTHSSIRIPQSKYLEQLETAEEEGVEEEKELQPPNADDVRYWSDYNHAYFSLDSIHPISFSKPVLGDETQDAKEELGWTEGITLFGQYDKDHELIDTSLRRLTEECDSLQGFQAISDSASFAGFSVSLLEQIADEHPKSAKVDFNILDNYNAIMGARINSNTKNGLLTNSLSLFRLSQLSDLSIPLLPRSMWEFGSWTSLVPRLEDTPYHTSALYAAHIESISWPIRKAGSGIRWDKITRTLNRDGKTPFACLTGLLPALVPSLQNGSWRDYRLKLSMPKMPKAESDIVAQYSVGRGISESVLKNALTGDSGPNDYFEDTTGYPTPLSHPQFFDSAQNERTESVCTLSTLTTRPVFGEVIRRHAQWCENYVREGKDLARQGLDADEMKEVVEGLRTTAELYAEFGDESDSFEDI